MKKAICNKGYACDGCKQFCKECYLEECPKDKKTAKEKLIEKIIEQADTDWIGVFVNDVLEFDWSSELERYDLKTLKRFEKETRGCNP